MLAPILSFSSDEAWEFVPGGEPSSVHLATWEPIGFTLSEAERSLWATLFHLRDLALPVLEQARQAKHIGKALEAKLTFTGDSSMLNRVTPDSEALRELLNVSQLEINPAGDAPITISVDKASGQKCERCWHWETDVGKVSEHPTLCGRCVKAISG
jgi:isoleucyl-tRNA synthetase